MVSDFWNSDLEEIQDTNDPESRRKRNQILEAKESR